MRITYPFYPAHPDSISVLTRLPSRSELLAMSRIAVPVVLAQVGLMLMGVVDTLMVGRVSAEALAAVALGNLDFTALRGPASGPLLLPDAGVAPAVGEAGGHRAEVHPASGVLAVQLDIPASEALLRLRAHAYATDQSVAQVAADIVAHRLYLEHDGESDQPT